MTEMDVKMNGYSKKLGKFMTFQKNFLGWLATVGYGSWSRNKICTPKL
jgi:hypothetical protein